MNFQIILLFFCLLWTTTYALHVKTKRHTFALKKKECLGVCEVDPGFPYQQLKAHISGNCETVVNNISAYTKTFQLYAQEAYLAHAFLEKLYLYKNGSDGLSSTMSADLRAQVYRKVSFHTCAEHHLITGNEPETCNGYIQCMIEKRKVALNELAGKASVSGKDDPTNVEV